MQVFADIIFQRLANAKWIECDESDIEAICKHLETADNMYLRSFAIKMKNASTIILTTSAMDD